MSKKPAKTKKGKPPPIDKLIKPAIVVGIALLAYQFMKGLKAEIPRVNVNDELELREVFFGEGGPGKSYAVLCHDEDSTLPISSVFQDAYNDGSSPAEFRLIDCNHVLPSSGKSVVERFNIDTKIRPTIFLSGAVGEPKQIPSKHLKTGAMLTKLLRGKLEARAAKVENTQDLRTKCLDKDICGLLLKGTKTAPSYLKDAMAKLLKEYPNVAFAAVDAVNLYVKNLEEFLPELSGGQPRFVVFQKVSGSTTSSDGGRLITSIAPLPTNGVSYGQMSNLVASVVGKKQQMQKLSSLPMVVTRTKKLEEAERAKRERRIEQQRRQHEKEEQQKSGGTTTPGGAFRENDGSREGRRAERDRRRREHHEKHNIKEKTPEEIAEMERRRRIRMEEESAKWNVGPEDAPPTGESIEEDDDGEYYMDEDEEGAQDLDDEDGDEEDVIDLD